MITRRDLIRLTTGGLLGGLVLGSASPAHAHLTRWSGAGISGSTPSRADLAKRGVHVVVSRSDRAQQAPFHASASVTIIVDGRILQFGFGRGVIQNLAGLGIGAERIDEVYFPSLSPDTLVEYPDYLAASLFTGRKRDVLVFGPRGTRAVSDTAVESAKRKVLAGNRITADCSLDRFIDRAQATCKVTELAAGILGHKELYRVTASRGGQRGGDVTSLVFRTDSDYGSIALGGGAGSSEAMKRLARDADLLLHECTTPGPGRNADEPLNGHSACRNEIHELTTPAQLGELAGSARVKMLVPYYTASPASLSGAKHPAMSSSELSRAIAHHFNGAVRWAENGMVLTMD